MFVTRDSDRRRLPVVLLSGFLGSGKTTLVNALLRDPRLAGTAVAINEFGEVPLDQHLIEHGADKTVVLANGCLCCNLAGDMEEAVMRVFARRQAGDLPAFARLVIEPSGLADPAPIAQAILRNPVMARALRLEAIVSAVDALFIEGQLARHPETRKQVALADQLVLTKTDLADPATLDRVRAELRGINPLAPIHEAPFGALDPGILLPPGFLDPAAASSGLARAGFFADPVVELRLEPGASSRHGAEIRAVSLLAEAPLRWPRFNTWLRGIRIGHAEKLLRMKGMLNIADEGRPVVIQGVHHVMHTPVELEDWPDPDRRSRIVLVTQGIARGTIEADWARVLPELLAAS